MPSLTALAGLRLVAATTRTDRLIDVEGAGSLLLLDAEKREPRRFSVSAVVYSTSAAARNAIWDELKLLLDGAWLEVMILPWTDRICLCRHQGMTWDSGYLTDRGNRLTMTFLSPSAYLISPNVDMYSVTTAKETQLSLGTADSPFEAQFIGPATNPTLSYYDANGVIQGSLTLAITLASGEWLSFDSQTYKMELHNDLGVTLPGARYFDNGSRLFQLRAQDAVPGRGPALTIDSGSALVLVRNNFL